MIVEASATVPVLVRGLAPPPLTAHPESALGGATHCPLVSQRNGSVQPATSSQTVRQRFVVSSHRKGAHSVLLLPSALTTVWSPSHAAIGTHFESVHP